MRFDGKLAVVTGGASGIVAAFGKQMAKRGQGAIAAVGYLASDLASGITGVNLPVDAEYLVATPRGSCGGLRLS